MQLMRSCINDCFITHQPMIVPVNNLETSEMCTQLTYCADTDTQIQAIATNINLCSHSKFTLSTPTGHISRNCMSFGLKNWTCLQTTTMIKISGKLMIGKMQFKRLTKVMEIICDNNVEWMGTLWMEASHQWYVHTTKPKWTTVEQGINIHWWN